MAKNTETKSTDEVLVKVEKDGEVLEVHPTCLEAHIQAGWKIVEG